MRLPHPSPTGQRERHPPDRWEDDVIIEVAGDVFTSAAIIGIFTGTIYADVELRFWDGSSVA